ncbi:hypothetical protein FN846DRAFT_912472 [Sphaerosporella brunnea]|uniref:F-box domain-containing protein n=1 Tax=Sphaerosporella brunnea TaxID=1250544 RepID=A0A5J5EGH3_9PEZI|nr:hypothetical protein FN846DRAFT_912472 [Sphaerosporella brunnea]
MATLCSIPPELRIKILTKLPDLRSLAAAIFTSRAIYEAFTIARHDVMERVLDAEIPLASIISEIGWLLPQDCVVALQDRSSSVRGKALDMLCVNQGYVSAWCRRFCEDSLPPLPSEDYSPASPSERLRIQRAFYRFWALSRAIAASDKLTLSDDFSFAEANTLRYGLWEIAELTLVCRYIYQKLDRLCSLHGSMMTLDNIRSCFFSYDGEQLRPAPPGVAAVLTTTPTEDTADYLTVDSLALLDLPTLHALLFSPQTTTSIIRTHLSKKLSCCRTWSSLFFADRRNRDHDPTAFSPHCICTRRDMPSNEYDECLRCTAEDGYFVVGLLFREDEVRYDLALWDDSRLERLGRFLPVTHPAAETPQRRKRRAVFRIEVNKRAPLDGPPSPEIHPAPDATSPFLPPTMSPSPTPRMAPSSDASRSPSPPPPRMPPSPRALSPAPGAETPKRRKRHAHCRFSPETVAARQAQIEWGRKYAQSCRFK